MRQLTDFSGQAARLSQFVAMSDRVSPREAADRLECSPRTIQRWIQSGKLRKGADGKISYQAAKHLHLFQKTGRPPGKPHKHEQELLAKLPKNDEQLLKPFLKATHGQRRFVRLIDLISLAARGWNKGQRSRWADKLRDGAKAVESTEPTGARERRRRAGAKRVAYREQKRQWKKRRGLVEHPQDVIAQAKDGEVFRFYLAFAPPADHKLTRADYRKKIRHCLEATSPRDALLRQEKAGFTMTIRKKESKRVAGERAEPASEEDIAGEIDDRFLQMSSAELAAARAKWLRERPRIPRLQGNIVTADFINAIAAHTKWLNNSPTRATQKNRDEWLLNEIGRRSSWQWRKIDDGWGWEATPPPKPAN